MWVPKLEGIGSRYQSVTQNDGTLAEGNFPLTISGNAGYQAMTAGDIPFTMFYLAFSAILTLLGTLMADILYAVVDPRVRVN